MYKRQVLGTGVIANEMAAALEKNGKKLYAVGNRTYEKAVKFGKKYGIGKVYTDYNEMFTDPEVDVIYITTPHNTHIRFMKKAIENGKHILDVYKRQSLIRCFYMMKTQQKWKIIFTGA